MVCCQCLCDIAVVKVNGTGNVCFVDKSCQNAIEKQQEVINLRIHGTVKVGSVHRGRVEARRAFVGYEHVFEVAVQIRPDVGRVALIKFLYTTQKGILHERCTGKDKPEDLISVL
jgi:hypothetical protein